MKSPFPGMDPYLERHWPDVQTSLTAHGASKLNMQLPDDLVARVEERMAIEPDDHEELLPDKSVLVLEPITERFIRIIGADDERLITVVEFVSPTNKRGKGLRRFRRQRARLVSGGVNFVETDLVRTGDWRELLRPEEPPAGTHTAYRVTIRAARDPDVVYYQPISIREPVPAIKIPLRRDDQPVELELQPLIEQVYVNGRYARTLDYTKAPDPPLDPEDAAWAAELLKSAGRR